MMGRAYRAALPVHLAQPQDRGDGPGAARPECSRSSSDEAAARKGKEVNEEELAMLKGMLVGKVERESSARYATGRMWDDGIIDPRDTRQVLGLALSAIHSAPVRGTRTWGVFRH